MLHRHVLVMLWRVGAHLQPEHAVGTLGVAVAQDDIPVVYRLRAEGETAVHPSVATVLYKYPLAGTVGRVLVGPGALASLEHNGIVVHMHETAVDEHVGTRIDVDGVARRSSPLRVGLPDILRRGEDIAVQIAHVVALIDVVGPEGRVHQMHILYGDIARVGYVREPWPLRVLVGTLRVPLAPYPELLPVGQSVAIDGAVAADGESVEPVGIDQCTEIGTRLALDAGGLPGEVDDAV